MGIKKASTEETLNRTIKGIVSGDLKSFNGAISDDEGACVEFQAWTVY
jgi:hypothetical protein